MKFLSLVLIFFSLSSFAMELDATMTFGVGIRFGDNKEEENVVDNPDGINTSEFYIHSKFSFLKTMVDQNGTEVFFLSPGIHYSDRVYYSISPIMIRSKRIGTSISIDLFQDNPEIPEQNNIGISVGWSF